MKKVYTIIKNGGEWEDTWDFIEKAFFCKEKAEEYMRSQNIWLEKQRKVEQIKENTDYTDEQYEAMTEDEYKDTIVDLILLYEQCNYFMRTIDVEE